MSRIGKEPITVPAGVDLKIDGSVVTAKGKLGEQTVRVSDDVVLSREDGLLHVKPAADTPQGRTLWGTTRTMLQNLVTGVSDGFTYYLDINGVGYRAAVQGDVLNLQLGHSHDINYPIPAGLQVKVERNTQIEVTGTNKQELGQFCAEVRAFRPPEPYKGKGVKYRNEHVRRKEGKKK